MAEKTTLLQKNPPVESPRSEVTEGIDVYSTSTEQSSLAANDIVISRLESFASHSFLVNTIVLGVIGFVYAGRAARNTKSINFKACAGFACFAALVAMFYFFMNGMFTDGLWQQGSGVSLSLRSFAWILLGPLLIFVVSMLDSFIIQNRSTLLIPVGLLAAIFVCMGAAQLPVINPNFKLAFSAIAIVCACALTLGVFSYLAELPDSLDSNDIKGFQITLIAVVCGWLGYSLINMASLYIENIAMSHLLINCIDLFMISTMAYGIHACMTFKMTTVITSSGKKLKKPKMKIPLSKPPGREPKKKKPVARSLVD